MLTGNCDGKSQDTRETRRYRGARLRECRDLRERKNKIKCVKVGYGLGCVLIQDSGKVNQCNV